MEKRKRYKSASKAEIKILQERNWMPVTLAGEALPSWLNGIPEERLLTVYGSGTGWDYQILKYGDENRKYVVAGYDVFRYDPDDEPKGYPINMDHYIVFEDTRNDDMYFVAGPIESDHKWLAELPKNCPNIRITVIPEVSEDDEN